MVIESIITLDEYLSEHAYDSDRMLSKMPPEKVPQAQEHIKRLEFHEGIAFNFGGRVGSSVPSRQLLYLGRARGAGVQTRVAEELFRGLWEGERDISHIGTLVEIAGLCGLDVDEVRVALEKGEGVEEVKREQDEVKGSGVRGVPHYIVGGMHLDGAVDLEDFFDVLVKAKESR